MSRIHDALKRAEEEKTSALPTSGVGQDPPSPAPPASVLSSSAGSAAERLPLSASPASGETVDAAALVQLLQIRCPQASWKPDWTSLPGMEGGQHAPENEEFRSLRSHLYLLRERRPLKHLLITSPLPDEGKTFVSANLTQVMVQQAEQRVLVIDADLRRSSLHHLLGAPPEPGLTNFLRGEMDAMSAVKRGLVPNLFFIPRGQVVSNSSELLGNGRLKMLLQELGPAFDWIILDTPPVIPVSDAKLMADLCDGVLIVVQSGTTPYDLAQKTCKEFPEGLVLGVILNRVNAKQAYSSYYYYEHGTTSSGGRKKDRKR